MKIVEVEIEPCLFRNSELPVDGVDRLFQGRINFRNAIDEEAKDNKSFPRDTSK